MKRLLLAVLAVLLLAGGATAAYVLYKRSQEGNIRGSSTEDFVTTKEKPKRPRPAEGSPWPMYGFDQQRTRDAPSKLRPPFRKQWTFRGKSLLEFPPAVAYGQLFFTNNGGATYAIGAHKGRRLWRRATHRCTASSPAVAGKLVYQAFLNHPPCNAQGSGLNGLVVAYSAKSGRVRWTRKIGPSESSPLVAQGNVFVGDWNGRIYAFDAKTGHPRWTFATGDKVKGGLAYFGGRVFAGSYDHHVYALRARTGKLVWRASAQERLGPLATFYSTPAVAYGRVYIGGTDGRVYSYGASSGALRWSHDTGSYVYASPAVSNELVFIGSYTGVFYAFDAATGDVRWQFQANGPISGSATVLNGIVYFATLKQRTYALNARTGRQLWTFPDGKYSPVVADSKRLYLVGHTRVYGMVER